MGQRCQYITPFIIARRHDDLLFWHIPRIIIASFCGASQSAERFSQGPFVRALPHTPPPELWQTQRTAYSSAASRGHRQVISQRQREHKGNGRHVDADPESGIGSAREVAHKYYRAISARPYLSVPKATSSPPSTPHHAICKADKKSAALVSAPRPQLTSSSGLDVRFIPPPARDNAMRHSALAIVLQQRRFRMNISCVSDSFFFTSTAPPLPPPAAGRMGASPLAVSWHESRKAKNKLTSPALWTAVRSRCRVYRQVRARRPAVGVRRGTMPKTQAMDGRWIQAGPC